MGVGQAGVRAIAAAVVVAALVGVVAARAASPAVVYLPAVVGGRPPGDCDAAYPTVCIPSPPPDLNCDDLPWRDIVTLPPDPHNLDADNDGIGCESPP